MIAFHDNLPLVQLQDGQAVAFQRDWLIRSLANAARKAGYPQWWLAAHVAQSVTEYLRTQTEVNVLSVDRLTKAVQSVLQVIGYADVGQHFEAGTPATQISLVDVAREAGTGYELAFFEILGRRIQTVVQARTSHFELLGLEPCVKLLRARKTWSRDCDALRVEIVSFTRNHTGLVAADRDVTFSLA